VNTAQRTQGKCNIAFRRGSWLYEPLYPFFLCGLALLRETGIDVRCAVFPCGKTIVACKGGKAQKIIVE